MDILDLLDELERRILNGRQTVLMKKTEAIVDKHEMLDLLEAIRKVIDEKYQMLRLDEESNSSEDSESSAAAATRKAAEDKFASDPEAFDIVKEAKREAQLIKSEIDEYADHVLLNLKLTVTKFKRKLVKLDNVLDMSRDRLEKSVFFPTEEDQDV
jgi:cell division septum initiation protein DivIVA